MYTTLLYSFALLLFILFLQLFFSNFINFIIAVLPQQSIYAQFEATHQKIVIAALFGNPNRYDSSKTPIIYDTREVGVTKETISPTCAIDNFLHISIYEIDSCNRNVILKYQGQGVVELRKGTTTKLSRNTFGMLRSVIGVEKEESALDMTTNADTINCIFNSFMP